MTASQGRLVSLSATPPRPPRPGPILPLHTQGLHERSGPEATERSLHYAGTNGEKGRGEQGAWAGGVHGAPYWEALGKKTRAPYTVSWPFNMTAPNSFLPSPSSKCYFSRRRAYSFIQQTLWECHWVPDAVPGADGSVEPEVLAAFWVGVRTASQDTRGPP